MEAKRVPRCRASGHPFLDICPGRQIRQVGAPGLDMSAARRLHHRRDVLFTLCLMVVLVFGRVMPALGLEQVSLQLKWKHQFQFAGYYAAVEKGFYRDNGLDVSVREGGPDIDAGLEVAKGAVDFGVCTTSVLVNSAERANNVVLGDLSALRGHHSGAAPDAWHDEEATLAEFQIPISERWVKAIETTAGYDTNIYGWSVFAFE